MSDGCQNYDRGLGEQRERPSPALTLEQRWAAVAQHQQQAEAATEETLRREAAQEIGCGLHPGQMRKLDYQKSVANSIAWRRMKAEYALCPKCVEDACEKAEQRRLEDVGVPDSLLHASFKNWLPRTDDEKQNYTKVLKFLVGERGFLFLAGPAGCGKSHLAVAMLRSRGAGMFITHRDLLRGLRMTYTDNSAKSPVATCQHTPLLVLDDLGVSAGGKDDAPLLYEVLAYRYEHKLSTVITTNANRDQLAALLGDRLVDRMREAAFAMLTFTGTSHRAEARDEYFSKK